MQTALIPLAQETRSAITTREAAGHLNRSVQTLRLWACEGRGPIKPLNVGGRLAWKVEDLKRALEV